MILRHVKICIQLGGVEQEVTLVGKEGFTMPFPLPQVAGN